MTASLRDIRVYTTFPHACSYLAEQEATTLFIDPRQTLSQELYTQLSLMGFRRSGDHLYRPHCSQCSACIPTRVAVTEFKRSKSQKRVWRRNKDLEVRETDSIDDDEAYVLYERYIRGRHADGDMFPPERDQYRSFLNNGLGCTRYFRFYDQGRLIAIVVADQMLDGLSAIYTFYDPEQDARSLGTYAVLFQIDLMEKAQLDYVYLGYLIRNCNKMNYKSRFRPLELFRAGGWQVSHETNTVGDIGRAVPMRFVENPT
ncbi:MAG: arginyltransferase [Luminiphilus sp.]|jgi:arginyl-tRNA--protein-N-Asp/Glu arginylyltransferase|nr:arginyltransferase [Luminiphilus sp.]MDG1460161.1 arginyltransferase [Luminiphilus sp.]